MQANRVRCNSLVAVPVSVATATVTKILDQDDVAAIVITGVQNRTGGDIYFAYSLTAPADDTTMILLTDGQSFMAAIGEGMPVGNIYVRHAQGSNKTVHAIKGY